MRSPRDRSAHSSSRRARLLSRRCRVSLGAKMRYLAVARFRLLISIREATPGFIMAAVPPLLAGWYETMPEPLFRAAADELLGRFARAAMLGWVFHALIIVGIA